jgi:molybdopterin-binding protein
MRIKATLKNIKSNNSLNIITLQADTTTITMLSLQLNQNIKIDTDVILSIKPTNISIAKDIKETTSHDNLLKAKIEDISSGNLLSSISLIVSKDIKLESIITNLSLQRLSLQKGDNVVAMISASDISIIEVLDD